MNRTVRFALASLSVLWLIPVGAQSAAPMPEMTGIGTSLEPAPGPAVTGQKPRFQMSATSENTVMAQDQKVLGSKAPLVSLNSVGLLTNISQVWAFELREYFEYASHRENLGGRSAQLHQSELESGPTTLRLAAKPTWGIFGSKPLSAELRYYLPNDRASQENHEAGFVRADAYAEWMLNTRWSGSVWTSARTRLNTSRNPNTERGSDAEFYELKAEPYLNYYFNDDINAYLGYTFDGRSLGAQRGNWDPDVLNLGSPEIGVFWVVGPLVVNPSLISDTNLANADGAIFNGNSRAFAEETLSYNLNIYATF